MLISMPHAGTTIPARIASRMEPVAMLLADTDWHLPLLYNMAEKVGASTIRAEYSRYVIDLNRPKEDSNLYPGQDTTGLCPIDTFAKQPLYRPEHLPDAAEMTLRIERYWQPYHHQLQAELERLRQLHGYAILWDAHSIASHVPRFFSGKLPDFNFGTADQKSCAPSLQQALQEVIQDLGTAANITHVFNGRFKGGYITRQYGQPAQRIHAVQLEMAQCLYMDEAAPYSYRPALAAHVQPLLSALLATCLNWAQNNGAAHG